VNPKPAQLIDRTLRALAKDIYKPQTWASLHAAIFPERFINPETSNDVIHQAILRSRKWQKYLNYRNTLRFKF